MATVSTDITASNTDVQLAAKQAAKALGYDHMKPEQLEVVCNILTKDVFAVLPTGFGKTLCYTCLPAVFDQLLPSPEPSIVIVVTPLIAIMQDQVMLL